MTGELVSKQGGASTGAAPATVEAVIHRCAELLRAAGVCFGHGSDNAVDEAAELVFFAAGLRHEDAAQVYGQPLTGEQQAAASALVKRRIEERLPAAYLTRRMWFGGLEFYVDERVLVPRSPIAELIEQEFRPWLTARRVRRILDIGTGSGCIAVACAMAFPDAMVDAADVSEDALQVARINIARHGLAARVRAIRADVWPRLASGLEAGNERDGRERRYDLIVSNPPYVSHAEMAELPQEYLHEPALGLRAGDDGLDVVRRILAGAAAHLTVRGLLVVEVGDSEHNLNAAFPSVPFTWLQFERGGGGVFLLTGAEVAAHAAAFAISAPK